MPLFPLFAYLSPETLLPMNASAALKIRETSSRKPMDRTMPNENRRSFNMPFQPVFDCGFTPQIVFRASRNSMNTPDAPKSNVKNAITLARSPDDGFCAFDKSEFTMSAPRLPIICRA